MVFTVFFLRGINYIFTSYNAKCETYNLDRPVNQNDGHFVCMVSFFGGTLHKNISQDIFFQKNYIPKDGQGCRRN